jgi:hypothetical protein
MARISATSAADEEGTESTASLHADPPSSTGGVPGDRQPAGVLSFQQGQFEVNELTLLTALRPHDDQRGRCRPAGGDDVDVLVNPRDLGAVGGPLRHGPIPILVR